MHIEIHFSQTPPFYAFRLIHTFWQTVRFFPPFAKCMAKIRNNNQNAPEPHQYSKVSFSLSVVSLFECSCFANKRQISNQPQGILRNFMQFENFGHSAKTPFPWGNSQLCIESNKWQTFAHIECRIPIAASSKISSMMDHQNATNVGHFASWRNLVGTSTEHNWTIHFFNWCKRNRQIAGGYVEIDCLDSKDITWAPFDLRPSRSVLTCLLHS